MPENNLEGAHQLFDVWLKSYEATFGRMAVAPALGPTRERTEQALKSSSESIDLFWASLESMYDFQTVFMEALRRTQQNFASKIEEDIELDLDGKPKPEAFKDFYKTWIETYSDTFKTFLESDEFSSDMSRLLSQSIDFQKNLKKMIEENFLKPANLPTKTEIAEMEKEIYDLKRKVKDISKTVKELSDRKQ